MVNQSGCVTSYPGWTIYQLAQGIHREKFFLSFYIRQQILSQKSKFILKSPERKFCYLGQVPETL